MKNKIRLGISLAVILAVFTVLYFVIPYGYKNETLFALNYIFAFISFLAQIYFIYVGMYKKEELKSKFYGIPVIKFGLIYLSVQLGATILFTLVNCFVSIPMWIIVIIEVIIIALAILGLFVVESAKEHIENSELEKNYTTEFIKKLKIQLQSLSRNEEVAENKKVILRLVEICKYSDPVSCKETKDVENRIIDLVNDYITNHEQSSLSNIEDLLEERKEICKINK